MQPSVEQKPSPNSGGDCGNRGAKPSRHSEMRSAIELARRSRWPSGLVHHRMDRHVVRPTHDLLGQGATQHAHDKIGTRPAQNNLCDILASRETKYFSGKVKG